MKPERLTRHFDESKQENLELYDLRDIGLELRKNEKLSKLEDIEEELGIDLIVLAKALKQGGVYVKSGPEVDWATPMQGFQICGDKTNGVTLWSQVKLDPKEYGKTWAVTKEELIEEELE